MFNINFLNVLFDIGPTQLAYHQTFLWRTYFTGLAPMSDPYATSAYTKQVLLVNFSLNSFVG